MTIDFTPTRRAVVRCLNCGTEDTAAHVPAGYAQFCGCCGRKMTICDADPHGCGSVPAQDAPEVAKEKRPVFDWDDRGVTTDAPPPKKEETWRDRPALF